MSLQFVLGRANTPKSDVLLDEVAEILHNEPASQIFYLVPDHIKFESEMNVLNTLHKHPHFKERELMGMIRLQVFSFSRLAWYLLQNAAVFNQPQLTEAGLNMLVRKILLEREEDLTIYRGESRNSGFVSKITELVMEFRSGQIELEDLDQLRSNLDASPKEENLRLKLQDIQLIYSAFMDALAGNYIEKEDIMDALIQKIYSEKMSDTYVFVEHFQHFNAQEQQLLLALMQQTKKVTVALTLDQKYTEQKPEPYELFYTTGETYHRLYQTAREYHIPVLFDKVLTEVKSDHCSELDQLERYWVESSRLSPVSNKRYPLNMDGCIQIWEAENKQAEVTHTATAIRDLIAKGEYRFKDIVVLARNMDEYTSMIESIFSRNDIALFVDQSDTMSGHPLVEFVEALLLVYRRNWRYPDMMRLLRTELLIPRSDQPAPADRSDRIAYYQQLTSTFRNQVDVMENVVLAYGYEGHQWTQKKRWHYTRFELDEISEQTDEDKQIEETANQVKEFVSDVLQQFYNQLKRAKNNTEAARILYQFLERNGINDQLLFWRDQAIEAGDLDAARQHEQVWQTFIQLLDEYVDVLGDEAWNVDDFLTILEAGFENATYGMVPASIDQVIFSSLTSVRPDTAKVVFLLGMTDTNLPASMENDSVLTDEDRSYVDSHLDTDKYLRPGASAQLASEPFTAYMAFMSASDKLYFSYPKKDDSNNENNMSPYVKRIQRDMGIEVLVKPADVVSMGELTEESVLSFIGTPQETLSQLILVMREAIDKKQPPHTFWLQLYQYFNSRYRDHFLFNRILYSLSRKNVPVQLLPDISEKLYGKDLYLSVSQLESFYLDPYSHFLTYGLRLRERPIQELTPAETGSFFHDALDQLFKTVVEKDVSFKDLDSQALDSLTDEVLSSIFGKEKYSLLSVSNRMLFIRQQLGRTIKQMAWALNQQSKRTPMEPQQSEVLFGRIGSQTGIPGFSYPLKTGGQIHVRGKIDRVDALEIGSNLYLSVVDYKSSNRKINFTDFYYGLAMQMLTYLGTALLHSKDLLGKEAEPAGAFYYHVKNAVLKPEKPLDEEERLKELLKAYKLEGFVLDEEKLIEELDDTMDKKEDSLIFPTRRYTGGDIRAKKFITKEQLELLLRHNQRLIVEAGNRILRGETSLQPFYERKQFTPSVGGEFRAISQFDVLLPENNYRTLESMKQQEVFEKLKELYEEMQSDEEGDEK